MGAATTKGMEGGGKGSDRKSDGKATTVKAERECGVSKISEVGITSAIKRSGEQRRKQR